MESGRLLSQKIETIYKCYKTIEFFCEGVTTTVCAIYTKVIQQKGIV